MDEAVANSLHTAILCAFRLAIPASLLLFLSFVGIAGRWGRKFLGQEVLPGRDVLKGREVGYLPRVVVTFGGRAGAWVSVELHLPVPATAHASLALPCPPPRPRRAA